MFKAKLCPKKYKNKSTHVCLKKGCDVYALMALVCANEDLL